MKTTFIDVMHLVIFEENAWSDKILWINDIYLKDGALPTINCQSASIIGLEPAVWAKVVVLDLVLVNLTEKTLQWTTCTPDECCQRRCKHGIEALKLQCIHCHSVNLDSDDIVRQCDFHELLRISDEALRTSPESPEMLWEVFRLLHLYILPLVFFTKDADEGQVDQACDKQNKVLVDVERRLDEKSKERGESHKELQTKRHDICQILEQDGFDFTEYCDEFITILEGGLNEDLKHAFTEIDKYCREIQELKQRIERSDTKADYQEVLQKIKKERDEFVVHMTRVLLVREEIENFCRSSPSVPAHDGKQCSETHHEYIEKTDEWKLLSGEAERLFWIKIHAVSIREALSYQQHQMKFSQVDSPRATISVEVIGRESLPTEWQTVEQQMNKCLETSDVIIDIHTTGQDTITGHCMSALTGPRPSERTQSLQRKGCVRRKESDRKSKSYKVEAYHEEGVSLFCESFLRVSATDMFAALTTKVNEEIRELFHAITDAFLQDSSLSCKNRQRIWICYEKILFPDVLLHYIIPLYQRTRENDIRRLRLILGRVTLKSIGMDGESKLLGLLGLIIENKDRQETSPDFQSGHKAAANVTTDKFDARKQPPSQEKKMNISSRRKCFNRHASVHLIDDTEPLNFVPFLNDMSFKETMSDPVNEKDVCERADNDTSVGEEFSESFEMVSLDPMDGGTRIETVRVSFDTGVAIDTRGSQENENKAASTVFSAKPECDKNSTSWQNSTNTPVNVSEFQRRFQPVFQCFSGALTETVPYLKLERLTRCLSKLTRVVNQQAEASGMKFSMSADDLLSSVILLLAYGHPDIVTAMYTHIVFLRDYIPTFMENGKFGYTLITFLGAYSTLLEISELTE